jgi:hypothetical protein
MQLQSVICYMGPISIRVDVDVVGVGCRSVGGGSLLVHMVIEAPHSFHTHISYQVFFIHI